MENAASTLKPHDPRPVLEATPNQGIGDEWLAKLIQVFSTVHPSTHPSLMPSSV
jgi:hypothetical protein